MVVGALQPSGMKVGHGGLNHQLIATENTTDFGPHFR